MAFLSVILPIFIVLITGHVLMRFNILNQEFINVSNRLIFNVFLPVLLFYKIAAADFSRVFNLKEVIVLYAVILLTTLISFILAAIIRLHKQQTGTFVVNSFRGNLVYIGMPVCLYAFGEDGLAIASVLIAFATPLVNILSVIVLNSAFNRATVIKETLLNPLIIGAVLGIVVSAAGLALPLYIERTLSILSGITLPLALLAIGATINFEQFKGSAAAICSSSAIKLLIMPLTAYLFFRFTGSSFDLAQKVLIVLLACPTAAAVYIFAAGMNGDAPLANSTIVATTIASLISFIMWLNLLGVSF